jgi:hypothetical protein
MNRIFSKGEAMNLTSLLEVLNANKDSLFAIVGVKGKVMSAVVADNLVKMNVVEQPKYREKVSNVLVVLGKLDAATAGALEVVANGKVVVSASSSEDYVTCKVS